MRTVLLYKVRMRRKGLRQWARCLPREIGAALVAEAFQTLLSTGDATGLEGLEFARLVTARRRRNLLNVSRP